MSNETKFETLHHPTLPSTVEVEAKDVDSWVEAGWRKTEPVAVKRAVEAAEDNSSN